jgi:hypothetical protein
MPVSTRSQLSRFVPLTEGLPLDGVAKRRDVPHTSATAGLTGGPVAASSYSHLNLP